MVIIFKRINNFLSKDSYNSAILEELVFLTFLSLSTFAMYYPSFYYFSFADIDDHMFYKSLSNITSFKEFLDVKKVDFQPLRDLFFLLDIGIQRIFPKIFVFRLSNWFIFNSSLIVLYKTISSDKICKWRSKLIVLAVGVHPVFVNSVCWFSAKKHLLGFLFLSLYFYYEKQKKEFLSFISFVLLTLSHPQNILVVVADSLINLNKKILIQNLLKISVGVFFIVLNIYYYYYSTDSESQSSYGGSLDYDYFSRIFLAPGRYFYNSVMPIHIRLFYDQISWQNIVGLFLIAGTTLGLYYKKNLPRKYLYIAAISIVPVTLQKIIFFAMDSYAISFTAFLMVCLLSFVEKRIFILCCLFYLLVCPFYTRSQVLKWKNFNTLLRDDYINEPNRHSLVYYVAGLFSRGESELGVSTFSLYKKFYDDGSLPRNFLQKVCFNIDQNKNLSKENKETLKLRLVEGLKQKYVCN